MTELLYLPDNEYQEEFDTEVSKVKETLDDEESDGYLVLEETLFYKEGGGQPADHGEISWDGENVEVVDVQQEGGDVRHYVKGDLPEEGQNVRGEIDWERRHKHMRMHTAEHVLSWVTLNMYDAAPGSTQIHEDDSRVDFEPADFTPTHVEKIEKAANALIQRELEVEKKYMDREGVEEKIDEGRINLDIIPDHIDPLRVIVIGGEDICPCGGTHVDNLEEIGEIEITNRKSAGSNAERIRFELKS